MPVKINQSLADFESRIPAIRDEWINIGLSTEVADRPAAESAADVAYQLAGLEPPRLKIWLRSPLEGAIGATMLVNLRVGDQGRVQAGQEVWAQVWDQIRDQVGDQIQDQIGERVGDQIGLQLRQKVGIQVVQQVEDQIVQQAEDQIGQRIGQQIGLYVRNQVAAQVRQQVLDQVGTHVANRDLAQVRNQVRDQVYHAGYGQHDVNWLGFYSALSEWVPAVKQLAGLMGLARSCGWFLPFANAIILTERPCQLSRDDENRLHSTTGPAMGYPDGFSLWRIHGVAVERVPGSAVPIIV